MGSICDIMGSIYDTKNLYFSRGEVGRFTPVSLATQEDHGLKPVWANTS
jgi:hypothetical protein